MFVHLKAIEACLKIEAYLKMTGRLPVNVICLFEGEEEVGSPSLPSFLVYRPGDSRAKSLLFFKDRICRGGPDEWSVILVVNDFVVARSGRSVS